MKIYSVDSTESREKQKKASSKILPQAGLDLMTSDFQVLNLNPYSHALLTPTKSAKSKNQQSMTTWSFSSMWLTTHQHIVLVHSIVK